MGEDIFLKQIARDLTHAIKNYISVDWSICDSVQAKITIRRLLKKYCYPPDKMPHVVEIVMEQTRLMCQNESVEYRYQEVKSEKLRIAEDETKRYI